MNYQHEIDIAMYAARQAGDLALRHFASGAVAAVKPDLSPVTIADRECEQLISGILAGHFPDDGILGEEGTFKASRSQRRWIIDPIDGTRDFVRGTDFWAIQIALEDYGDVVLGAVYFPCLNEMLHAVSGMGCFWNGSLTKAVPATSLEKSILLVSGLKALWKVWDPDRIRQLTEACWTVRSYGASYDVLMLARGRGDIWLSGGGMEWDYAPARIIAQEVGVLFLTRNGVGRIDLRHCLICPPGLAQELREILLIPESA